MGTVFIRCDDPFIIPRIRITRRAERQVYQNHAVYPKSPLRGQKEGIGHAVAEALGAAGAQLMLSELQAEQLARTASDLQAQG